MQASRFAQSAPSPNVPLDPGYPRLAPRRNDPSIVVADSEHSFLELEHDWRELVRQVPDTPLDLSWEWVSTRWKHFNQDRTPWIVTARGSCGTLIGIAPFAIYHGSVGPLKFRILEFLGRASVPTRHGVFDGEKLDLIIHPEFKECATSALLRHFERDSPWDVADIGWLSSESSLLAYFKATHYLVLTKTARVPVLQLPEDWESYEQSVLGRSRRKQLRYDARRLERDFPGEVEFRRITSLDEVRPAISELINMNVRRFSERGEFTPFEADPLVRFHHDFAEAAFNRGWLRFYQLRVRDRVISANCDVVFHNRIYGFHKGFDPAWKKYGPGYLSQSFVTRKAIEEGLCEFDLGHGDQEAKRLWSNAEREDVQLFACRAPRGAPYYGKVAGLATARSLGRRLLREDGYRRLKRIVGK